VAVSAASLAASPRARRLTLLAILAVAVLVRLAAVLLIEVDPRAHWSYDMSWYDGAARRLAKGWGYIGVDAAPTAAWPPGYPALLAALYAVFGPSLLAAKLANVVFGAAAVLLTYLVACELRRPLVGLVAAAILAVFPGWVLFAPLILSESLFVFLFCAVLWLFLRLNRRGRGGAASWLGLGVFLGAISLVRGVGFFLLPVFASTRVLEGASWRSTARLTLVAAAGVLLALLPWTIRNHLRLGYPILIASDGAFALYMGNSPIATGYHTIAMREPYRARFGELLALPNPRGEVEVARTEVREALAWMVTHPHRVAALAPVKVYHMYRNDRGARTWMAEGLARRMGPATQRNVFRVVDAYWLLVLGLALVGSRHFRPRDGPGAVALPLTVAWMTLLHAVLFFGGNRLHVPLLPALSVMAAAEIVSWRSISRSHATMWRR
jgi:4-amino-4-deoxy-L-arabinose transferase-like glycosyltransferase